MMYDIIVIGAGPGGHAAALEAARLGATVAVIEKEAWGGTCVHRGCIPTKALLACSKKLDDIKKFKRMGVSVGEPSFDLSAIKRHQNRMVRISSLGVRKSLEETGVELIDGEGIIASPNEVEVRQTDGSIRMATAKNIVIAWGSQPVMLPNVEFSNRIIDSDRLLAMDMLPERLIIVGGGAIGIELATIAAKLGTGVTVIELMDQLLPYEERDAAEFIADTLKRRGIDITISTSVESIEESDSEVRVRAVRKGSILEFAADYALICIGRRPVLRSAELEKLAIWYDQKGIKINNHCMTSVRSIYAVGDVTGGILLAHRAAAQGRAVAGHLFGDGSITWSDDFIPAVVYTHPALARVGFTEELARKQERSVEVRTVEYGSNIIARTEIMGNGFIKMIFEQGRLIGVTIVGDHAADLIASMALAVGNKMTKGQLRNWVLPHPTLSELLNGSIY
ncbi:MAG TPA: dihydrolipoyl dehydrogenase [Deltaproteobacteria bacterium]|nr:dihydrolipoyl dehydrogenase [Deltaproteobacteria bacterium]